MDQAKKTIDCLNDGCPNDDTLRDYLSDQIGDDDASTVEECVEDCTSCELRMRRILDASVFLDQSPNSAREDIVAPPKIPSYEGDASKPLGVGGFGVVWPMRDVRLNRDVAVKVMRFRDATKPTLLRRFLAEAQICSQLAHPFIVPVYELGELTDGRGYYVMKLVKGQRLDTFVSEAASQWTPRIRTFGDVCQAMAFAHEHNVVHRDLKPQNIMVGEHGEVQVMDWGLAKVISEIDSGESEPEKRLVSETVRVESDQTAAAAIGTYPYMPPEQAKNAINVDARSDVFSLGAILCELLTGKPPYVATDGGSVQSLAINAQLDDAHLRLNQCSADPRIINVARRCLSPELKNRPRDARQVADSVQQFLSSVEEELQQERIANERQKVQFEEEAKRRRFRNLVGMLVGGLLLIGSFATLNYLSQQAQRKKLLQSDSAAALQKATEFVDDGQIADAKNELLRITNRIETLGSPEDFPEVLVMLDDVNLALDLVQARRKLTYNGIRYNNVEVIEQCKDAFRNRGLDANNLDEAAIDSLTAATTRAQVLPYLDFMVGLALHAIVWDKDGQVTPELDENIDHWLSVARQVDPNQNKYPELRNREIWGDGEKLFQAVKSGLSISWNWSLYDLMFDLLVFEDSRADGVGLADLEGEFKDEVLKLGELLRRKAQENFGNDSWVNYQLGTHLLMDGKDENDDEVPRYLQAAVALDPENATAWTNFGFFHTKKQEFDSAKHVFERALQIEPDHFMANFNLSGLHLHRRRYEQAQPYAEKAIELAPDYWRGHMLQGELNYEQDRIEQAKKSFERTLELKSDDLHSIKRLAFICRQLKQNDEAIVHWKNLLEIDATSAEAKANLLLIYKGQKKYAEALQWYERIGESGIARFPAEAQAEIYDAVGMCYVRLDDLENSIRFFEKAIEKHPDFPNYTINLGVVLRNLGQTEAARKQFSSVLEFAPGHEKAQRLLDKLDKTIAEKEQADLPQTNDD